MLTFRTNALGAFVNYRDEDCANVVFYRHNLLWFAQRAIRTAGPECQSRSVMKMAVADVFP